MSGGASIASHISEGRLTGQNFIPQEKREVREYDGAGSAYAVLQWVKEHEGEAASATKIAQALNMKPHNAQYHLDQLVKKKKITKFKEKSNTRSYRLGILPTPRQNGEVKTVRPAAPFSRSQLDRLAVEAFAHLREQAKTVSTEELGGAVKAIDALLANLEHKIGGDDGDKTDDKARDISQGE